MSYSNLQEPDEDFLLLIGSYEVISGLTSFINKRGITKEDYEPIPFISEERFSRLFGCCQRIYQSFGSEEFYKTKEDKAAQLFFSIITGHILENGNKRMAVVFLVIFCLCQDLEITIKPEAMYDFSCRVASNGEKEKRTDDEMKAMIKETLFKKTALNFK